MAASRRSSTARASGPPTTSCSSSSSTSPRSARRWRTLGVWDETDGLYYDQLVDAGRRPSCRSRSARWSASSRCSPRSSSTSSMLDRAADARQAVRPVPRSRGPRRPRGARRPGPAARRARRPAAAARRRRRRPARAAVREAVRRATSSSRRTACGRCPPTTATTPTCSTSRASRATIDYEPAESTTACSAATPTGGARSGSRSTTSSISALERYHRFFGDELHHRVPDRHPARARRSTTIADDLRARLISLFLRRARTGGGRASAASSACSATRRGRTTWSSTSTSTATTAPGSARRTRPAGPAIVADLIRRPARATASTPSARRRGCCGGLVVSAARTPRCTALPGPRVPARRDAVASGGTNFAVASERRRRDAPVPVRRRRAPRPRCRLQEYDAGVWHGFVAGVGPGQAYGFRVTGPYDPARGHALQPGQAAARPLRPGDRPVR